MCFFLDPSPVRRVPIQTGIQRKLNFVSVRTIKGSSSVGLSGWFGLVDLLRGGGALGVRVLGVRVLEVLVTVVLATFIGESFCVESAGSRCRRRQTKRRVSRTSPSEDRASP